jgi:hypothetical protein
MCLEDESGRTSDMTVILVRSARRWQAASRACQARRWAVRDFIRSRIIDEFSLDDIRSATPASDPLIKKILQELRAGGAIGVVQRGRYARYRRLHTNF